MFISDETSPSLIIPSLGEEDVANYACNASNIAGYEYKNVIVNILTIGAMIKVILASDWSVTPILICDWTIILGGAQADPDRQQGQ